MASLRNLALFLGAFLPAALAAPTKRDDAVVPGKYIVTLKADAGVEVESHLNWVADVHRRSLSKRDTAGVENTFNISTWNAYSGEFDKATLEEIKASPDVCIRKWFSNEHPNNKKPRSPLLSQTISTTSLMPSRLSLMSAP